MSGSTFPPRFNYRLGLQVTAIAFFEPKRRSLRLSGLLDIMALVEWNERQKSGHVFGHEPSTEILRKRTFTVNYVRCAGVIVHDSSVHAPVYLGMRSLLGVKLWPNSRRTSGEAQA